MGLISAATVKDARSKRRDERARRLTRTLCFGRSDSRRPEGRTAVVHSNDLIRWNRKGRTCNHWQIKTKGSNKGEVYGLGRAERHRALTARMIAGLRRGLTRTAVHDARHVGSHGHIVRHGLGSSLRRRFDNGCGRTRCRQHCHRQGDHQSHHRSNETHCRSIHLPRTYRMHNHCRQVRPFLRHGTVQFVDLAQIS